MRLEFVETLPIARRIYDMPRDMKRFHEYIRTLTGGTDDLALPPLGIMNPMGKPHVAAAIDTYLAAQAEDIARSALREAAPRLAHIDGTLRVGIAIADDVSGGWTDRHMTDAAARLECASLVKRGWATALLWASEPPLPARIREETLTTIYRALHVRAHGTPRTLREVLRQEGRALLFAGADEPILPSRAAEARATLLPHFDSSRYPAIFAAIYGDEAARKVGHAPLGVPEWAGLAVALEDARDAAEAPEAALRS